jgi:hypothetical protein
MTRKRRKPTGVIGDAVLRGDGRQTFSMVTFPDDKDAIEQAVMAAALASKGRVNGEPAVGAGRR